MLTLALVTIAGLGGIAIGVAFSAPLKALESHLASIATSAERLVFHAKTIATPPLIPGNTAIPKSK